MKKQAEACGKQSSLLTDGLNDRKVASARIAWQRRECSVDSNRRGGVNRCRAADGRGTRWKEPEPVYLKEKAENIERLCAQQLKVFGGEGKKPTKQSCPTG